MRGAGACPTQGTRLVLRSATRQKKSRTRFHESPGYQAAERRFDPLWRWQRQSSHPSDQQCGRADSRAVQQEPRFGRGPTCRVSPGGLSASRLEMVLCHGLQSARLIRSIAGLQPADWTDPATCVAPSDWALFDATHWRKHSATRDSVPLADATAEPSNQDVGAGSA